MDERLFNKLSIICILFSIICISQGLRITKVEAPGPLVTGEGGWLECEWELEDDALYAIKWYLGLSEFYRWTPAENPAVKTFPINGNPILVDLESSQQGRVRIHQVTLAAGGVYRCEVSAEAPSFHTESAVALMSVVDLPDMKPRITGTQLSYQMHEDVLLNCSSLNSHPPAILKFYVNDEQADPSWLVPYETVKSASTGLETAVLGLQFPLWPRLLRQGNVNVKCSAEIPDLYWDSNEVFIAGDIPYHASIMEDRASSSTSSSSSVAPSDARMTPLKISLLVSVYVLMVMV